MERENGDSSLNSVVHESVTNRQAFHNSLSEVLSQNHKIISEDKSLSQYGPDALLDDVVSSEIVTNAFALGLNGGNPSPEDIGRYFFLDNYQLIKKRNRLGMQNGIHKLPANSLPIFDETIAESLFGHAYLASRFPESYKKYRETGPAISYHKAFGKVLSEEDAPTVIAWIFANRLVVAANSFGNSNLDRLSDNKHSTQLFFPTKNDFFLSLAPSFYFLGWGDRLARKVENLEASMPSALLGDEARKILLARMFANIKLHGVKDLSALVGLLMKGRMAEARALLSDLQIQANIEGEPLPLKKNVVEALGIGRDVEVGTKRLVQEQEDALRERFKKELSLQEKKFKSFEEKKAFEEFVDFSESLVNTLSEKFGFDFREKPLVRVKIAVPRLEETSYSGEDLVFKLQNGVLTARPDSWYDNPVLITGHLANHFSPRGRPRRLSIALKDARKLFGGALSKGWKIEVIK